MPECDPAPGSETQIMATSTEASRKPLGPLTFQADRWYTPHELAGLTPWQPCTLALWRCQGSGPPYTKIGRRVFYLGADLQDFFTSNQLRSTAELQRPSGAWR